MDKDVKAGKAAGYHTGVVTCGVEDPDKIKKASPELIAKGFRDLRPWLRWLGL